MSAPVPTPVPTQTAPPPLSHALGLLDGLLLRDDVPAEVLRVLGEVFDDLVDVRPPYPPTTPTDSHERPWPVVVQEVAADLHELAHRPVPAVPATRIRYGLALRALHETTQDAYTSAGPQSGFGSGDGRERRS